VHAAALVVLRSLDGASAYSACLAENARARRFYEVRGWRLNGQARVVPFPRHPLDVGYSREL